VILVGNNRQDYGCVFWTSIDGGPEAGREVGTGIYMYRLTAADVSTTKKLVIVR
jgi:hypothetical protein